MEEFLSQFYKEWGFDSAQPKGFWYFIK
jgi:hypothetical protein